MASRKKIRQKWLGAACLLEEQSSLPWERFLIVLIILLILGFIQWASVTPLDELVSTTGELVPSESITTVQAGIGGIIQEIFVKEGSLVKRGDVLVKFQLLDTLEDIRRYDIQRKGLKDQLEFVEKELQVRTLLAQDGLFPSLNLLQLQAKRMEILNKIQELNEVSSFRFGSADSSNVRAPISGLIQELRIPHTLASVHAGEALMNIVPVNVDVYADLKIKPSDIGNIHLDQPVILRVTTFDSARFGVMTGKIIFITPASIVGHEGIPYFRARVELAGQFVRSLSTHEKHLLKMGMMVEAEIKTGTRTIMEYLLKPVVSIMQDSLHER